MQQNSPSKNMLISSTPASNGRPLTLTMQSLGTYRNIYINISLLEFVGYGIFKIIQQILIGLVNFFLISTIYFIKFLSKLHFQKQVRGKQRVAVLILDSNDIPTMDPFGPPVIILINSNMKTYKVLFIKFDVILLVFVNILLDHPFNFTPASFEN